MYLSAEQDLVCVFYYLDLMLMGRDGEGLNAGRWVRVGPGHLALQGEK